MHTLVIIIHLIACFLMIGAILLQSGKGAEIGAQRPKGRVPQQARTGRHADAGVVFEADIRYRSGWDRHTTIQTTQQKCPH